MYIESESRNNIWKVLTEYIQKDISYPNAILDLGCGYGNFINNVRATYKFAVDSTDVSSYLDREVRFSRKSVLDLGWIKNSSLDCIFASNIFEHLSQENFIKCLKIARSKLLDDGLLVVLQPNFFYGFREYFNDFTHKTIFTHVSMCDLFEANGFRIIKCVPKFLPYSLQQKYNGSWIPEWLYQSWIIRIYLYSPIKPFATQMYIIAKKG
jgi:SAM-dependent methyltransferase